MSALPLSSLKHTEPLSDHFLIPYVSGCFNLTGSAILSVPSVSKIPWAWTTDRREAIFPTVS